MFSPCSHHHLDSERMFSSEILVYPENSIHRCEGRCPLFLARDLEIGRAWMVRSGSPLLLRLDPLPALELQVHYLNRDPGKIAAGSTRERNQSISETKAAD